MEQMEKNRILPRTLYLVATPIGNLADLSPRAVKILSEVDFIAAEDTRNAQKLLSFFDIHGKELISYFEHNKRQKGEYILSRIEGGESCALITDAGTPAISDPGEDLVRLCAERHVTVTGAPGCCAAVHALSLSGLMTGRFAFEGFMSVNKGERKKRLAEIQRERRTMIFYEAPHKLQNTLSDLADCFGEDRKITLCRELTKLNEEICQTTLKDAIAIYQERAPKGEYVLILAGLDECPDTDTSEENPLLTLSPEEHLAHYEALGFAKMDAMKKAAKDRGISKSEFYRMLHKE